jgi:hypothetical protein
MIYVDILTDDIIKWQIRYILVNIVARNTLDM